MAGFFCAFLVLVLAPAAGAEVETDAAAPHRVVTVVVATDAALRDQPGWHARVETWLATVDAAYRDTFGIGWRAVAFVPWEAHAHALTAQAMLATLEQVVPATGAEVVLGLSGRRVTGTGASRTLDTHALAALPPEVDDRHAAVVIAHELAHLFGAWHVANARSVMYGRGARALRFDNVTREVIALMRDHDFARGVTALGAATVDRLGELFAAGHAPSAIDPVALALATRGVRLAVQGARDRAITALRLAANRAPRCGACQIRLAYMLFEKRAYDEAMTRMRRAMLAGITPDRQFASALVSHYQRAAILRLFGCARGDDGCALPGGPG